LLVDRLVRRLLKPLVFLLAAAPLAWGLWDLANGRLGANPVESLTHRSGDWALRMLLLTLAITPLRRIPGWGRLLPFRRMLGLYAFFYASVHLAVWIWLDQRFHWYAMLEDVTNRPYIALGLCAWLLMLPLAITSTRGMMRRLQGYWRLLHRAAYAVGVLAVLHYLWLVKADYLAPAVYAAILVLLLALRLQPLLASGRGGGRCRRSAAKLSGRSG
jgi:sulfoxide reductase heme-binding subunit YedZ